MFNRAYRLNSVNGNERSGHGPSNCRILVAKIVTPLLECSDSNFA